MYETLGILPGRYTLQGCKQVNRKRLFTSKYANLATTECRRKIRRGKTKAGNDLNVDTLYRDVNKLIVNVSLHRDMQI